MEKSEAINVDYVLVKRVDEQKEDEGFSVVEIQDSFVFKGEVVKIPDCPMFVDNRKIEIGDIIMFSKFSPSTQEIDYDGQKMKIIKNKDILILK